MVDGADEKNRRSIAFINRRRRRSNKSPANSGNVVKSWAKYSEVSFTPSGSAIPGWLRLFLTIGVAILSFSPFLIMLIPQVDDWKDGQSAAVLRSSEPDLILYFLVFFILGVLALGALVIAVYFLRVLAESVLKAFGKEVDESKSLVLSGSKHQTVSMSNVDEQVEQSR